eukprot:364443-Chlamydomonas_euryale.AAC.18
MASTHGWHHTTVHAVQHICECVYEMFLAAHQVGKTRPRTDPSANLWPCLLDLWERLLMLPGKARA